MIQVILTKEQLDMIGDLRHVHVNIGACLALMKKGVMDREEGMRRIGEQLMRAEDIWRELAKEGI